MNKKLVANYTHDEIAEVGAAWVRRQGCPYVFANVRLTETVEQPDVIGFNFSESWMLEAKVSRADFLADKKKPFRTDGTGMGKYRGYIAKEGIIKPEEVPHGWWLLEVYGKHKPLVRVVKGIAIEKGYEDWMIRDGRAGDPRYLKNIRVSRHGEHRDFNNGFWPKWARKDDGSYCYEVTSDNYRAIRHEMAVLLKVISRMKRCGLPIELFSGYVEPEQFRFATIDERKGRIADLVNGIKQKDAEIAELKRQLAEVKNQ